ncbi:MAG: aspartate 1-decarboxylase [Mycobacteriaceae bacterium]|nr:aspartate 1-decarboxylase [Mycobacteriaceae bacterium]
MLPAKLHQVRVTHCERDYVGSIAVDMELMEQVGMLPLKEVDVVNLENGNRWSTYVLPAARCSQRVCPNGGGAMLCEPDDRLLIRASFPYVSTVDRLTSAHGCCAATAPARSVKRIVGSLAA